MEKEYKSNWKKEQELEKEEGRELILVSLFGVAVFIYFGIHLAVYLIKN